MRTRLTIAAAGFVLIAVTALLREAGPSADDAEPGPVAQPGVSLAEQYQPRRSPAARAVPPAWQVALTALKQVANEADERDPYEREARLLALIDAVPLADAARLLNALARGEVTAERLELGQRLARRWAENDPATAAEWAVQLPESTFAQAMLAQSVIAWANTDLRTAAEWTRALPDGETKTLALTKLGFEAVRTSPVEALRIASELEPGDARNHLALQGAREWAAHDPPAAAEWVGSMADGPLRDKLLGAIAADYAERDPVAAANLALDALPPGRTLDHAVVGIVQRWAQNDAEQAAQWVNQFPEGALRRDAAQNLVALWGRQDLTTVSGWLSEQPPGPSRDTAVSTYVSQLARRAPASAAIVPWLDTIADAGLRERTRAGLAVDGKAP